MGIMTAHPVMAGEGLPSTTFIRVSGKVVDGPDRPGHDDVMGPCRVCSVYLSALP